MTNHEPATERLSYLALRLSSASWEKPVISSYGARHQWQPSTWPSGRDANVSDSVTAADRAQMGMAAYNGVAFRENITSK